MTTPEICTLSNTLLWFQKAVPTPTVQNFTTQLGVHYEEVVESMDELHCLNEDTEILLHAAKHSLSVLATHLKENAGCVRVPAENECNFLDALCDQLVTATGTAYMRGYDVVGALQEVNASNFSKFKDGEPLFNENKKVMKGPDYFKPNLATYVGK